MMKITLLATAALVIASPAISATPIRFAFDGVSGAGEYQFEVQLNDSPSLTAPYSFSSALGNVNCLPAADTCIGTIGGGASGTVSVSFVEATGNFAPLIKSFLPFDHVGIYLANSRDAQVTISYLPEPTGWAMMMGGMGMIGAAMRRRSPKVAFS